VILVGRFEFWRGGSELGAVHLGFGGCDGQRRLFVAGFVAAARGGSSSMWEFDQCDVRSASAHHRWPAAKAHLRGHPLPSCDP
jgi:hypothetical protein